MHRKGPFIEHLLNALTVQMSDLRLEETPCATQTGRCISQAGVTLEPRLHHPPLSSYEALDKWPHLSVP